VIRRVLIPAVFLLGCLSGTAFALDDRWNAAQPTTSSGQVWVTDSLRDFTWTPVLRGLPDGTAIDVATGEVVTEIDVTPVSCHGGRVIVEWHVGNLEPQIPHTGIHLAITMDGEVIGGILAGSADGIYDDWPAQIVAAQPCPAGPHVFAVKIQSISGYWGIPYAQPSGRAVNVVQRGFVIWEVGQ
jgi:hypothetical protein